MPLPSSIRGLVLFAFPLLFSAGCQAWRVEGPLPERETFLDIGTPIAPTRELVEVNDLTASCYDRLRGVTLASWRTHNSHRMVGLMAASVANTVVFLGSGGRRSRGDPPVSGNGRIVFGVTAAALALTTLDLAFHPSVRAARSRRATAMKAWSELSQSMNRWESNARGWSVASANGDTTAASASRALWRAEDGVIRERAFVCAMRGATR